MAFPTRPRWTDDENAILRQQYASAPEADLLTLLPQRNWHGIQMQAGRLRLPRGVAKPGAWSEEHMAILREHYPTKGAAYVAALVGRSANRVTGHAHDHCIPFTGVRNPKRTPVVEKPPKGKVGRPKKAVAAPAIAPAVTTHDPRPKSANTLKPMQVRVKADASPSKGSPKTPNLNARVAARLRDAKVQAEKPRPFVTAAEIKALSATHPARLAYTKAAYHGPAAATKAFHEAMNQAA